MEKRILLTFDDGPDPALTPELIEALAANDVTALFFVVGSSVASPRGLEIVRDAVENGNWIGNHSFSHVSFSSLSDDNIRREVESTQVLISELGRVLPIIRPPYGELHRRARSVCENLGYIPLLWDVDTGDWRGGPWIASTLSAVLRCEFTDIVLLAHDTCRDTVGMIDSLIEGLVGQLHCTMVHPKEWPTRMEAMSYVSGVVRPVLPSSSKGGYRTTTARLNVNLGSLQYQAINLSMAKA